MDGKWWSDGEQWDYIVVGAGAGGAPAAARLALAGQRVLLVEAGRDPPLLSRRPGVALSLIGSRTDWQYETISNNVSCLSSVGQQCRFNSGKGLGGSTSINFMLYMRGNRIKDFEEIPLPGWTFSDLMPYFLRSEGLKDLSKLPSSSKPYHNTTGPMSIGFFEDPLNPMHYEVFKAHESLRFPYNSDINAESQVGVTRLLGYIYRRERMSTARAYLAREDVKKALEVTKNTMCIGVIIHEKAPRGITVVKGSKTLNLYARKEIILSAGTIRTSQILMLSGIGPADHLNSMGVPVKVDLPIGDRLIDHVTSLIIMQVPEHSLKIVKLLGEYLKHGRGALTFNSLTDILIFTNSYCYDFQRRQSINESFNGSDCEVPDTQISHGYIEKNLLRFIKSSSIQRILGYDDHMLAQLSKANENNAFILFTPILMQPRSVGTVRLSSADPLTTPAIRPNYLSDEQDVEDMVRAINIIEDMAATPTFAQRKASILHLSFPGCPPYMVDRQQYWRCYVRYTTHAMYHATGTVPLGTALDARLRVRGVSRLRVADLSVLPHPPRASSAAVTIAIGERVVDFLLEDNK